MRTTTTLAATLLSAAILAGCADAGPLAPVDSSWSTNAEGVDRLPPLPDGDPVMPLPPVEDPPHPELPVQMLDPVFPMPPVEDPVKPLPPPEGGGGGGADEDERNSR